MKNPEIMDANGTQESLSIMFHKDNCSVIAIQDATEDSVTGPELAANLTNYDSSADSSLTARLTNMPGSLQLTAGARLIISAHGSNVDAHRLIPPLILC